MTDDPILAQLPLLPPERLPPKRTENQPNLHTYWVQPERLPEWITSSALCQRYLNLLGPLDWDHFPERNLERCWGKRAIPYAALVAAEFVKLNEGLHSFGHLHQFLVEHPGLIWLFGFPRRLALNHPFGFNALASLPTVRHLTYLLRHLPNAVLQALLTDSVNTIRVALAQRDLPPIDCISLDTKHVLAWVKENNPKAYLRQRYDKTQPPAGDPDCRLGCKRRHNRGPAPATPTREPVAVRHQRIGEFYWGYGSGIVVTQIPGAGEFVLAELTQPFDQGDLTYFHPLMQQTEARLGYRPHYGTFDAAFDAWYVYAYFHRASDPTSGFAAVPFSEKGGYKVTDRQFTPEGLPICAAGLPMPLYATFTDRATCLIEHERAKYGCPLQLPGATARRCPVRHANWAKGGCLTMMPTSIGARLRYTLDRQSPHYKDLYRQRTAVERINAQAVALGIERPHLRNGAAIANQNTLIYTLINLRFLQRLHANPLPIAG